jgi:hypothetical protein
MSPVETNVSVNTSAPAASPTEAPGSIASGGAQSQDAAAAALVTDLYKQHDAQHSPFFQTKDRALVDKYFTKATADLIWKDAVSSKGEVGALEADPLYNAQDTDIKNFAVGQAEVKGQNATVPVTFTNYGTKVTVKFALKMAGTAWKIDDIIWPEGDTLVKTLKANDSQTDALATAGVFEGRFQVGDTTCTVRPSKMTYEVRWAKGSGVENFFYKDQYSFESDTDNGSNRFEFDDESYSTGVFYRADGKEFPVKRLR